MFLGGGALIVAVQLMAGMEETVGGYTWTYRINGDMVEIYNNYYSPAVWSPTVPAPYLTSAVPIPSMLGGKPVTRIGICAFSSSLTGDLMIPDSVTSVGNLAFTGCDIMNVMIPRSVTNIGYGAFYACEKLRSFSVHPGNPVYRSVSGLLLTKDGKNLVAGVNGDVGVPDGVVSIENVAFAGCCGLTSVTIPDSVTNIGNKAFYFCRGLTSVAIPMGVTKIGDGVFSSCGLTSVTIPDGVTSIGRGAFSWCRELTSVTIPGSVTRIGYEAFLECESLTRVVIPDAVVSIEWNAFCNCSGLMSVELPKRFEKKVPVIFVGCSTNMVITYRDSDSPL